MLDGSCSGDMERSELGGSMRKRRRRRRKRGRSQGRDGDAPSASVSGASSAEESTHGSSSLEVKENRVDRTQLNLLHQYHPASFCSPLLRESERKRPLADGSDRNRPPSKRASAWATSARKNALVQLNELRPGLRYETASEPGPPPHAPVFSVRVQVDGTGFEGRGPTKKKAKMRAAQAALRSFVQFPNGSRALAENSAVLDEPEEEEEVPSGADPGPVGLLERLRPGLRYMCLAQRVRGGGGRRRWVVGVRVEGRVFEGCAQGKRPAKARAAAAALQALQDGKVPGPRSSRDQNQLPRFLAESIFHLVRQKYDELTDAPYKVLAGIVMTRGSDLGSAQVVSLASGTRCLDSSRVSDRAWTLCDCHAEVLCRRALVRFLYSHLELLLLSKMADGEEQSIFAPNVGGGGVRLRKGVFFHMCVTSSPCGDARLNCPYETAAPHPGSRFRCHLRVKVNGGEGTLPVGARRANQERAAAAMSCTDKMAKWCVAGLQGALLSHLVEPVYLHSLTVATLSHTGHLSRALGRRLAAVRHLPFPYRRRQPLLSCLSSRDARPPGKPPSVSLNWSCGDVGPEEISTSTGRRRGSGAPSRLCRGALFLRWKELKHQVSGGGATMDTYPGSKMAATRYQRVLQQFGVALQGAGLGAWPRKPSE